MSRRSLKAMVEHEVRLDILCLLDDDKPLSMLLLSEQLGRTLTEVAYHLNPLLAHGLVSKTGKDEDARYEAALENQPSWVRRTVNAHKSSKA